MSLTEKQKEGGEEEEEEKEHRQSIKKLTCHVFKLFSDLVG